MMDEYAFTMKQHVMIKGIYFCIRKFLCKLKYLSQSISYKASPIYSTLYRSLVQDLTVK